MVPLIDINNLTHEELQEEYFKLFERYTELSELSETDAQRIHDLKRNLDTATAAEAFLLQELEQFNDSLHRVDQDTQTKLKHNLDDLRTKYDSILADNLQLQQNCEALKAINAELLEQQKKASTNSPSADFESVSDQQLKREQQLEQEKLFLLEKIEEFEESSVGQTMILAEREKNIEILRDQVKCMEENMRCKREELEEVTQLLESTQEQLLESNAKIAQLTAAPDNNDKKGNSLFAEVDDQRQAMKQLLAAQKKSYMQMKKVYNESEHEIRRLKRENIAMHTELQACSSIFCRADKSYQVKLNERIRQLLNQNEDLAKKLDWTQCRLKDVANDKGVVWIDSMLNFCEQETDELKKHLHSARIQKASVEEQLRNCQQEMARWRFEALKSRCVLLDRENLLTENKISFKPIIAMEISINDQELESSRPRIRSISANNTNNSLSTNSAETEHSFNTESKDIKAETFKDDTLSRTNVTEIENKENTQNSPKKHATKIKIIPEADECNVHYKDISVTGPFQEAPMETIYIDDDCELETPTAGTSKPPSILREKQSLFPKETNKTVHFSAVESKCIDGTQASKNYSNANATPQKLLKKSNVIVRRVLVKSKHES